MHGASDWRGKERVEVEGFERLKAELTAAFATPEAAHEAPDAETIIRRNARSGHMAVFHVQDRAGRRLDEIYIYSRDAGGEAQASQYIQDLIERFGDIASRKVPWRAIPAEFGVDGFYCRHEHHCIYRRLLSDGAVGIVTVLHERMHQIDRFREDLPKGKAACVSQCRHCGHGEAWLGSPTAVICSRRFGTPTWSRDPEFGARCPEGSLNTTKLVEEAVGKQPRKWLEGRISL